ncbi:glycosyl transferase [Paenibacillus sp. CCS19]|uniref:hypothetical protein n=1 Tax=Paenibacillus sp. CCS19 TaxID=3158387 RepID=UPI0025622B9D|nr:hypothetical protein [Paenibacillus cellulosilyticus]GMK41165.1 glycosyl transferase [Paenibacillus cellulosilyticus]
MKNIYICFLREESEIIGILNKIRQQCIAINNLGYSTGLIISRNDSVVLYEVNNGDLIEINQMKYTQTGCFDENRSKYFKGLSSLIRLNQFLNFAKQMINEHQPESVYIRNIQPITSSVAFFIRSISKKNMKVYWEIPTYSKSHEKAKNIKDLFYNLMHRYISRFLTNNVAIAAEEGLQKKGFIFTTNGVNVRSVFLKKNIPHEGINLICVATFDHWHGYDRLIEGLRNYYDTEHVNKKQIVQIHMVGNGNVQPLIDQVNKYNLNKYIKFHGVLRGVELDEVFDSMDIAVGNLGFHRIGVFADTSIKIREYCARGIPFITALNDSDFPSDYAYLKKVPADESAIDILSIIMFYEKLKNNHLDYSKEMRRYAENHLTWEQKMRFIVESV